MSARIVALRIASVQLTRTTDLVVGADHFVPVCNPAWSTASCKDHSKLEKIATEDEYFVKRGLYPNVDFYSGIILKAIGIPTEMFTVIFATGRTPGWIAHWNEMISTDYKIGRPRQLYTGHAKRDYPG